MSNYLVSIKCFERSKVFFKKDKQSVQDINVIAESESEAKKEAFHIIRTYCQFEYINYFYIKSVKLIEKF